MYLSNDGQVLYVDPNTNIVGTTSTPSKSVDVKFIEPETCLPGYYFTIKHNMPACVASRPGYFIKEGEQKENACLAGSYSVGGAPSCTLASPGYFVPENISSTQSPCTPGSYSSNAGSTICTKARPGYYVSNDTATTDTPCPAGSYSDIEGSSVCTVCPSYPSPNTYQPREGQTKCLLPFSSYCVMSPTQQQLIQTGYRCNPLGYGFIKIPTAITPYKLY